MPRRITVPDDHVGLVLPAQLADELLSLLRQVRQRNKRVAERVRTASDGQGVLDATRGGAAEYAIAGDVMLALLEAREG